MPNEIYLHHGSQPSYKRAVMSFAPLRELLSSRNITELQLSKRIDEKVGTVRDIQLLPETTSVEILRKICEALDCQPADIMKCDYVTEYPAKVHD